MRGEYILKGEGFLLVYSLRDKQSYMEIPTLHRQISQVKNADNSPCVIVEAMVKFFVGVILLWGMYICRG